MLSRNHPGVDITVDVEWKRGQGKVFRLLATRLAITGR
jgi:hypothetical protein